MSERVGFIGLGTMGLPMATNLAKGGVALVAYDASPAAQAAAARLPGATVAASVADAAAQCAVLFTSLPNPAIVRHGYPGAGRIPSSGRPGPRTFHVSPVSPAGATPLHTAPP